MEDRRRTKLCTERGASTTCELKKNVQLETTSLICIKHTNIMCELNHRFALKISPVNLDRIQDWIDQGRLDPSQPITLRELVKSRCIHGIKDGVKLLSRGGEGALKQPITIIVSRASASAIQAVEAAGGSITTRYYTRHAIKRILSGKTDPYVSLAWKDTSEKLAEAAAKGEDVSHIDTELMQKIGMGIDKPLTKGNGFQYRLPDPTSRRDIEYYRDPCLLYTSPSPRD